MRLGIDFGTTNSSISLYDGGTLYPVELDPLNDNSRVLPSLAYIDRQHRATLGTAAAHEYLARETGRPVRWEKRSVGEVEVIVGGGGGPIRYVQPMSVIVDAAANGRLLQSVKTALRDPAYQGTTVFDRFYTLDELIALVLRSLKTSAESQFGRACTSVVIGRPVRFSDDPAVTERGEEILYKAARLAGFTGIRFHLEPIGAAFLHHASTAGRERALVFDFGGGTLDLTVAELGGGQEPVILANRGVLVGGDDLDRRIMRHLMKHFGADARMKGGETFPLEVLQLLADWQTMPELSRPEYRDLIAYLEESSTDRRGIQALKVLVAQNLGFRLFQEIERAKKRLSRAQTTHLTLVHGELRVYEVLARAQFEELIAEEIARVDAGVRQVLDDARLDASGVDVVLRTGGTSLVPAFIRLLARRFGEEKLRAMDPLTSVVGGLAIVAAEGVGRRPACADRYMRVDHPVISRIGVRGTRRYERHEMRVGARCYADSDAYKITRLPVALSGLPAVRTASLDREEQKERFLRFFLERPARVYVAYKLNAASLPHWLQSFEPEDMQLEVAQWTSRVTFQLYGKDFPAGMVVLGANQAPGYRGEDNLQYLVVVRSADAHVANQAARGTAHQR